MCLAVTDGESTTTAAHSLFGHKSRSSRVSLRGMGVTMKTHRRMGADQREWKNEGHPPLVSRSDEALVHPHKRGRFRLPTQRLRRLPGRPSALLNIVSY